MSSGQSCIAGKRQIVVAKGARLLLGGKMPEGPGWFYPVTVLADVRPGMPAFDEETLGKRLRP